MAVTRNAGTPCESAPRLSWAQKRDLLGLIAAGVMTSALIVAPALVPLGQRIPVVAENRVSPAAAAPMPAAAHVDAPLVSRVPARAETAVRRGAAARPAPRFRASGTHAAVENATVDGSRKPLGRRFAELFTGDGAYSVRPFPGVAGERHGESGNRRIGESTTDSRS
jgi:hypothetical protein